MDSASSLTLAKKGTKIITTKTYGKETIRITCLLTIKGDGSKLKPFLIFKGKHNSYICKKLQNLEVMKNNQIYITTNENAWITKDLFLEYIDNVLNYDSH